MQPFRSGSCFFFYFPDIPFLPAAARSSGCYFSSESPITFPSSIRMIRSAICAISSLCVTSKIVWWYLSALVFNSPTTSIPVTESRLPVGRFNLVVWKSLLFFTYFTYIFYWHYVKYVLLYTCKEETIQMRFREIEKIVLNDGWELVDVRGSHHQYKHPTKTGKVTIPNHRGDIPQRVVNSILKQAGLKWDLPP